MPCQRKEQGSFEFVDWGLIAYDEALVRQTVRFEQILAAKKTGDGYCSALIFCEHNPVFTIGKSGKDGNLLVSEDILKQRGVSFFHTNRGGDVTYHGPGQITGYPLFDLDCWGIGLKQYIHLLEEIVIRFLSLYDIKGERLNGATGVWLEPDTPCERKICAIGVKSSRFVTMHGFALNINTDLSYYSLINPCGFVDKGVTSLAKERGGIQDFALAKEQLAILFREFFP